METGVCGLSIGAREGIRKITNIDGYYVVLVCNCFASVDTREATSNARGNADHVN